MSFAYVRADLDFAGRLLPDVAVRYKGRNSFMESRGSLNRPMKIDLDRGHPGRRLLGVAALNLRNNATDASRMREALSLEVFREAGSLAPRSAFAEVFLTVPGQHERRSLGLYTLVENVDREFLMTRLGRDGVLFEPETRRLFEDLGDDWAPYEHAYRPKTDVDPASAARLGAFCRLVSTASDAEFTSRVGDYLELDAFASFMAATVWLSSMDSVLGMGHNFYVFLDARTQRFQLIPWDLDHAFGAFPMAGSASELQELSIVRPWRGESRFLERMFGTPAFLSRYQAVLSRLNSGPCAVKRIEARIADLAARIRPVVASESQRKAEAFEASLAAGPSASAGSTGSTVAPPPPHAARAAVPVFGTRDALRRPPTLGRSHPRFAPCRDDSWGPPPRSATTIREFVWRRSVSVERQLRADHGVQGGLASGRAPFGGPPRRPEPRTIPAGALLCALDADADGVLSRSESSAGFGRLFEAWDTDHDGGLTRGEIDAALPGLLLAPAPMPARDSPPASPRRFQPR